MIDRDSLLRYRDAALRCNDAAQNVLAAFSAGKSRRYVDEAGNLLGVFSDKDTFPTEEAKTAFHIQWAAELEKACEEWKAAADCTIMADGTSVFEAVRAAAGIQTMGPPVVVGGVVFTGGFFYRTAHEKVKEYAAVVRDYLRGDRAKLPVVADLHARIEGESLKAVETLGAALVECFVTLQQAAAIVSRSKRTLEKHKATMPVPRISDGGGKPDEWAWSELRPWLEQYSGRTLPERFPANQFRKADG
jgi:hypothetical protein